MNILQSVVVKRVLTSKSKQELKEKFSIQKNQFKKEYEQLRFEQKKLEKMNKLQQKQILKQFEKEMNLRLEKINIIEFQEEQLHILPLGSEITEKEVQAIVEIKKGDNWDDINKGRTIVVTDGIITEIR
ncbi:YlqD family protein [Bacillaceae bacterium Marseille-Q3522]|nr:YlqD family protein [Bacillaceae bacterium Marseille-Q3522]